MADDLPPDASIDDIEEHIAFLDVCIDSLDVDSPDHDAKLQDLERQKQEAEQRLQDYVTPPSSPEPAAEMNSQFSNLLSPTPKRAARPSFDEPSHPFKRSTPNPPDSATPRSSAGILRLGGHPTSSALDRIRERQLEAEKSLEQRRQQFAADERIARELSTAPHSFSRPSAPSISSRQTTIGASGAWERPPRVKPEPDLSSNNSPSRPVKPEPIPFSRTGYQTAGRSSGRPLEVVDLTESDDEVTEVGNRSNGTPLALNPAYSRNLPMPSAYRPGLFPPQRPQAPTQPFIPSMPGAYPGDFSMRAATSYGYPAPTSSMSVFGKPNGAPRSFITGNCPYPAAPRLPGDPLTGPSRSNAWPQVFPIEDDDDLLYTGTQAKNPGLGNYAGREDLYYDRYDDVHNYDPAKTKEEINALLANISPDEEMPAHLQVEQPAGLTVKLHKYQAMGLEWLKKCETGTNKGGILADDMGLGKTVQMISLMLDRRSTDPSHRTNLIVAPLALLRQWKQEIETKVKPGRHRFNVCIHHGSAKKKDHKDFWDYDIVITTYGSLAVEHKKLLELEERKTTDPNYRPGPKEKTVLIGGNIKWYRVILDESQFIKNRQIATAKAAGRIQADYRFCVTGTPMMNNIEELYSLIQFLRIRPYCKWDKFRADFSPLLKHKTSQGATRESAMSKLQVLCKAVMLRRTKSSKYEGQPILVLPEKTTLIDNPEFDEAEQDFYTALETQTALKFNKYRETGSVYSSYAHILVMLLRLRQACCHPHLVKDFSIVAASGVSASTMEDLAQTLSSDVIRRVQEKNGAFECSVCWDAVQNPGIFIPCGHYTCADCLTKLMDNAAQSGETAGENGTTARCPECRGEINTKKLVDFETFKKVHQRELLDEEEEGVKDKAVATSDDDSDDGSDSEEAGDDDDDSDGLSDFIVDDDESINEGSDEESDTEMGGVKNEDADEERKEKKKVQPKKKTLKMPGEGNGKAKSKKAKGKRKAKDKEERKAKDKKEAERMLKKSFDKMSLAELRKLSTRSVAARREYLRRLRESWTSSAKIEKTLEILRAIMGADEGEKVLVFSQWTSLLDLVEVPIDEAGWDYRRYDGSMNSNQRAEAVDDFKDARKNVRIMLVSLKAGNAGLNLNVASQVVILDPFWNPYIEDQAVDRAHRLGQTRPVEIHRMLIQNTVEDRIMELQERKRALISEALDESAGQRMARLGVNELAYLFGITSSVNERIQYQERRAR